MVLRTYEALYIVHPELDDAGIQTVVKEVEDLVVKNGGTIVRSEIWGKRRLAYEVKKLTEGCYVLLRFDAEPEFIAKLELHFRLSDPIFRHLVSLFDEKTLRLEAEQQRRDAEAAASPRQFDDDDDDDDRPRRGRRDDDDDDERPRRPRRDDERSHARMG
ncbi:MAG: 30S ribosomal protein S6 [Candidatus Hydrogenedens sp.]|nr:30S ribosomal protein S6 [Candidatus Hydrogenedens sp.]